MSFISDLLHNLCVSSRSVPTIYVYKSEWTRSGIHIRRRGVIQQSEVADSEREARDSFTISSIYENENHSIKSNVSRSIPFLYLSPSFPLSFFLSHTHAHVRRSISSSHVRLSDLSEQQKKKEKSTNASKTHKRWTRCVQVEKSTRNGIENDFTQ